MYISESWNVNFHMLLSLFFSPSHLLSFLSWHQEFRHRDREREDEGVKLYFSCNSTEVKELTLRKIWGCSVYFLTLGLLNFMPLKITFNCSSSLFHFQLCSFPSMFSRTLEEDKSLISLEKHEYFWTCGHFSLPKCGRNISLPTYPSLKCPDQVIEIN